MERKTVRLVFLDTLHIKWTEYCAKAKRHFTDKECCTFGKYCESFKKNGYRIV